MYNQRLDCKKIYLKYNFNAESNQNASYFERVINHYFLYFSFSVFLSFVLNISGFTESKLIKYFNLLIFDYGIKLYKSFKYF